MSWRERGDQQGPRDIHSRNFRSNTGSRGRGRFRDASEDSLSRPDSSQARGRGGRGRGGHPRGLTGKEIGLYYRDLYKLRGGAGRPRDLAVQTVRMDLGKEQEISRMLGIKNERLDEHSNRLQAAPSDQASCWNRDIKVELTDQEPVPGDFETTSWRCKQEDPDSLDPIDDPLAITPDDDELFDWDKSIKEELIPDVKVLHGGEISIKEEPMDVEFALIPSQENKDSKYLDLQSIDQVREDESRENPSTSADASRTDVSETSGCNSNTIESATLWEMDSPDWWAQVPDPVDGISTDATCSGFNTKTKRCETDEGFELAQRTKIRIETDVPQDTILTSSGCEIIDLTENVPVAEKYSHVADSAFKSKFLENITGTLESRLDQATSKESRLTRKPALDEELRESFLRKRETNPAYKKMMAFREKLPAFGKRREIIDIVNENQVVLISGETGCGKTTQVGQFILDDLVALGRGSLCHVVCTQPRRISATSVARRVADERAEPVGGESVGYSIRLERRFPRAQGSILFCTTGVVLQMMMTDPGLNGVSHLILDEVHERNVTSDFIIAILKDVIPRRPDLKVILMSATLNAEQFSKYYANCPTLNIPGFTFPVEERYLEEVLELTGFTFPPPNASGPKWMQFARGRQKADPDPTFHDFVLPYVRQLEAEGKFSRATLAGLRNPASEKIDVTLVATLLLHICTREQHGAVLVFLPGWAEISKLYNELTGSKHFSTSRYLIIPLHSLMPTAVQKSVFDRPPLGVRKIVLATNIAETSITIDDVVFVVDCGKIKMTQFDLVGKIETLKAEWVSEANARQRRGRAGRVRAGVCYRLYSRARHAALAAYPLPEMVRCKLHQVALQVKFMQLGRVKQFLGRVLDPPDERAVDYSLQVLRNLNALDDEENLTPLGYHLAKLPMDPQPGKMILMAAIFSCVDPILSVAASLNFKDPFLLPLGKENLVQAKKLELARGTKSDHLVLVEAVSRWERARAHSWQRERDFCREYFLSSPTLKLLDDMKGQLAQHLHAMKFLVSPDPKAADANRNSGNVNLLRAVICAGLYPNVASAEIKHRKRGSTPIVRTPEDGRVSIHIRSVNEKVTRLESNFLLYHVKLKSTGISLHDTTMVYPLALLFFGEGVRVSIRDGRETINVNEHIYFNCRESTANVVKILRKKLDWILEHKISHPGTIDWNSANEGYIVREIIELISKEDQQIAI